MKQEMLRIVVLIPLKKKKFCIVSAVVSCLKA